MEFYAGVGQNDDKYLGHVFYVYEAYIINARSNRKIDSDSI